MNLREEKSEYYISKALEKVKTIDQLEKIVNSKCIYTKGVFDILHFGHLSLFNFISELKMTHSLTVVVGVASDRIVQIKKGSDRPINSELFRVKQIALLPQIDFVYVHDELDYIKAILRLEPVVYIKGMDTASGEGDYRKNNPETKGLKKSSSFIVFKDDNEISTSSLIRKIKGLSS